MDNQNLSIKKISADDADKICSFIYIQLVEDFEHIYKPQTIKKYQEYFSPEFFRKELARDLTAIGAFINRNLTGIYVLNKEFGGVGHIEWLGVERKSRSQGVGTKLIAHGEETAVSSRIHYLYLYTEKAGNIDFYKKRGFKLIGTHCNSWFGETEHEMGKHLKSVPFAEIFSALK